MVICIKKRHALGIMQRLLWSLNNTVPFCSLGTSRSICFLISPGCLLHQIESKTRRIKHLSRQPMESWGSLSKKGTAVIVRSDTCIRFPLSRDIYTTIYRCNLCDLHFLSKLHKDKFSEDVDA